MVKYVWRGNSHVFTDLIGMTPRASMTLPMIHVYYFSTFTLTLGLGWLERVLFADNGLKQLTNKPPIHTEIRVENRVTPIEENW